MEAPARILASLEQAGIGILKKLPFVGYQRELEKRKVREQIHDLRIRVQPMGIKADSRWLFHRDYHQELSARSQYARQFRRRLAVPARINGVSISPQPN